MENRAFDDALRQLIQGSTLPYEPAQWEKMARRLDAHASPKPARPRRAIPLTMWTAGAAAACLAVIAAWYINSGPSANTESSRYAANRTQQVIAGDRQTPQEQPTAVPAEKSAASPTQRRQRQMTSILPEPEPVKVQASQPARHAAAVEAAPVVADTQPAAEPAPARPSVPLHQPLPPAYPEAEQLHPERRMAFGVIGGYNLGGAKTNNFTVGVTVNRKMGSRLHLETGVAVVGGSYETRHMTFAPSETGSLESADVQTETTTNRLLYLQAAPSLSYELFGGVSAGGGVDMQRLLGPGPETAPGYNMSRQQSPAQPEWDFGLTARLDVRVAKKLRAGMMYRESVRSISKEGGETAKRNYLLLQLSYTIF